VHHHYHAGEQLDGRRHKFSGANAGDLAARLARVMAVREYVSRRRGARCEYPADRMIRLIREPPGQLGAQ